MSEEAQHIPRITTPARVLEDDDETRISIFAVFPDGRRMVTGSGDGTLRLWNIQDGVVLKKMGGHREKVRALAVSRDGRSVASGDENGKLIIRDGDTGESLIQAIQAHSKHIHSLEFSPDGAVLASGSDDHTTKLWCTKTWQLQGDPIDCGEWVRCVRYSPSGERLAIATNHNIQIWNVGTRSHIKSKGCFGNGTKLLTWTPDGTRLLAGDSNGAILEWDALTWKRVGRPWKGHTGYIEAIAINPAGTLMASASYDKDVRIWRLSDRRTIAIFQHSHSVNCVTFSVDGKHVLSGGDDTKVSEWVADEAFLERKSNNIIDISATARDACISGDLHAAEELLTQDIDADANNYRSYASRAFIMARKHDWDNALHDANKSIAIQPSLTGCISKGIALCGKGKVRDALKAFDIASMFTEGDLKKNHFLLLIKAIALFDADEHEEAILRVQELADMCPNNYTLACRVVEVYLQVQLGIHALDSAHHDQATDYFAAAVKSCSFSSISRMHYLYEDLVVLFGWDLESLWLTAHQKQCQALLSAGRLDDALESHRNMMETIGETTKVACLDWSTAFQQECSAAAEADRVLRMEIPGQGQHDGTQDIEPDFFQGMHDHHSLIMTSTSATSSPSQIHQNVVPSEVGWQFVPQYYTFINKQPNRLHCFYTKTSTFIHGTEGEDVKACFGQQEIHNKIPSLGFDDCKVYIHSVDAQSSANGGIIIQVIGEMSNHGDPWRKFVQTFFLAEQPNGYFVLNDIFRFLKEETVEDDASEQEASSTTSSDSAPESVREPTPPPPAPQPPKPAPKPAAPKTWASLAATDSKRWGAQVTTESKGMSEVLASAASPAPALAPVSDALSPTPRRKHPAIAAANALATSECFDFRVEPLQPPAQPAAPKTWASLAAAHSKRWGAQVATESIEMSEVSGAPSPIPRREHPAIAAANAVATPQCFVKGVTEVVSQQQLRTLLGRFGTVKDVEIVRTKDCAFLEFNSLDAAKEAIIASLPMDAGGEGGLRLDSPEGSTRIIVQTRMVSINRPWGGAPNGEDWGGAPNSETWGSVIRSRRRPRGRRGSPPPKQ